MDNKYIAELNKILEPAERIFKLKSAEYDGESVNIILIAECKKYDLYLNDDLKSKIYSVSGALLPKELPFEISYRKVEATEKNVLRTLFDFMKEKLVTLVESFSSTDIQVEITDFLIAVTVPLEEHIYNFCVSSNIGEKIKAHLARCYIQEISVNFVRLKSAPISDFKSQKVEYRSPKARLAKVFDVKSLYGYGKTTQPPSYIIDIDSPKENAIICGRLKSFTERKAKSNGNTYFSFLLNDTTGTIAGVVFPKKPEEISALSALSDNECVVVEGRVSPEKFTQGFQIVCNRFSVCAIDFASINISDEFKTELENYSKVFPAPIERIKDKTLLGDEIEQEITPYLRNKTFVVFDLETTNLIYTTEKIIEIAAIKVVDGVMTESFSTLINPEREISQNTTELTHIDNEMVKDAPVFGEAVGDFYKFTRNAILAGHNIDRFDIPFLRYHAKIEGYNFDNESIDTLYLSRMLLTSDSFSLEAVCRMFDISLIGAHRAINDVLANTKLFFELAKIMDNKNSLKKACN